MSILEQDEIDKLQRELANLDQRKDLALRAREKIRAMHLEILGSVCLSDIETLDDIGYVIDNLIQRFYHQQNIMNHFQS